jgi:hypothetical protein
VGDSKVVGQEDTLLGNVGKVLVQSGSIIVLENVST